MAKLIVVDGPDLGNEYELENPEGGGTVQLLIGRDPRVPVALTDNAVSREHCRVEATPRGVRVVDLGSRNKTYLNGDPIEESWLKDKDVLTIGDTEIRFEDDAPAVEVTGMASTIIKEIGGVPADRTPAVSAVASVTPSAATRRRAEEGERRSARSREILNLASHLARCTHVDELFERFVQQLTSTLEADHAAMLVYQRGRWVARSQVGAEAGQVSLRACLAVVERASKDRKAVLSGGKTRNDNDTDGPADEIHSAMAAPVLRRKEVAGVVYVDRRWHDGSQGRSFDDEDLELLRAAVEPLGAALVRLEDQSRLVDENRNLIRTISESRRIIGCSSAIQQVLEFIRRAAPTAMTVLIEGETGTGKELVASAIHYSSPRRGRPFVAINCAALPEHLVESELFGHERGAFTGAVSRKKGRFELANGGTVLLDEVGELTLSCQAKLLRLLEEQRFERVGGTQPLEVDVRIVAATNKDLLGAVSRKEFREDLYYRLSVLNVKISPLRERLEDIPLLVDHFLAVHGHPKKLSKAADKKLMSYSWPGNVRQLRNVIESAVVLGESAEIRLEDLALPEPAAGSSAGSWQPISLGELERRHVLKVLEHTRGNKKRAAEILGIERCTLYSKLKNYGT